VARLIDLGLESYLIAATMEGIVSQRLIRKICAKCKEEFVPTEEMLMELELTPEDVEGKVFYRGRGCEECMNSGYRGRIALFEIMLLNDELRELIIKEVSTNVLRSEARRMGMRSLRETGLLSIYDGVTTIDEVVRATVTEE
jgi:type IV pilus assembly protein PilB